MQGEIRDLPRPGKELGGIFVGRDASNSLVLCFYYFSQRPASRYFYPDLLHIKAEMEDGTIPSNIGSVPGQDIPPIFLPDVSFSTDGSPARFGFDQSVFPGFSWRGYAVMSDLQVPQVYSLEVD